MNKITQLTVLLTLSCIDGMSGAPVQARGHQQEVASHYIFVDPGDPNDNGYLPPQSAQGFPRPWKPEEKAIIRKYLAILHKDCPELETLALNGRNLRFLRVSFLNPTQVIEGRPDRPDKKAPHVAAKSQKHEMGIVQAVTTVGAVTFSSLYFARSDFTRRTILFHELVHCADFGGLVAYSPNWIKYPYKPHRRNNLREQVADYFAMHADFPHSAGGHWNKTNIAPWLFSNTQNRVAYNQAIMDGRMRLRENKPDEAITVFKEASRLFPQAPEPHSCLAECFNKKHMYKDALEQTTIVCEYFQNLGVGMSERKLREVSLLRAWCLLALKQDLKTAKSILEEILAVDSNNLDAQYYLDKCKTLAP